MKRMLTLNTGLDVSFELLSRDAEHEAMKSKTTQSDYFEVRQSIETMDIGKQLLSHKMSM